VNKLTHEHIELLTKALCNRLTKLYNRTSNNSNEIKIKQEDQVPTSLVHLEIEQIFNNWRSPLRQETKFGLISESKACNNTNAQLCRTIVDSIEEQCLCKSEEPHEIEFRANLDSFNMSVYEQLATYDILQPIKTINEQRRFVDEKKAENTRNDNKKLNLNAKVVLNSIDLSKYKRRDNNALVVGDSSSAKDSVLADKCKRLKCDRFSLKRSPNRATITKLDLKKKIFNNAHNCSDGDMSKNGEEEEQRLAISSAPDRNNNLENLIKVNINCENCISFNKGTPVSQYFKINDLISILVDEDYFNEKAIRLDSNTNADDLLDQRDFLAKRSKIVEKDKETKKPVSNKNSPTNENTQEPSQLL
jgi:hypothetical protein